MSAQPSGYDFYLKHAQPKDVEIRLYLDKRFAEWYREREVKRSKTNHLGTMEEFNQLMEEGQI